MNSRIFLGAGLAWSIQLFSHIPPHPHTPAHPLAPLHKELELFSKDGVFYALDRTRTPFGRQVFKEWLENPLSPVDIRKRQAALRMLNTYVPLKNQLTGILTQFAAPRETQLSATDYQSVYFTLPLLQKLNNHPAVLTALGCTYPLLDFMPVATHTLLPLLGAYLGMGSACCHGHTPKKHKDTHTHGHCHGHSHGHGHGHGSTGALKKYLGYGYLALAAAHTKEIVAAPARWLSTPSRYTIIEAMYTELQSHAQAVAALNSVYELLKDTPQLTEHIHNWDALKNLCTGNSGALNTLCSLLKSGTFKGNFSRFIQVGNVLVAHRLVRECARELHAAYTALGEIDALLGCTELVAKEGFAEVTISDAKLPYFAVDGMVHPFVARHAVKNSITLGGAQARNALFSGPSTAGKSTALKTVALSAHLGRTLGIAPAHALTMTPIDTMVVVRDIKDNTQKGASKFETVALTLHAVLEQARACSEQNKKMLVVLDDGIDGITSAFQETLLCNFLKALYAYDNIMVVAVTHSKAVTELAQNPTHSCTNYTFVAHALREGVGAFDSATELLVRKHPELERLLARA